MHALRLMLTRVYNGWAVVLTDGRELARFRGLGAKRRALRYIATGSSMSMSMSAS